MKSPLLAITVAFGLSGPVVAQEEELPKLFGLGSYTSFTADACQPAPFNVTTATEAEGKMQLAAFANTQLRPTKWLSPEWNEDDFQIELLRRLYLIRDKNDEDYLLALSQAQMVLLNAIASWNWYKDSEIIVRAINGVPPLLKSDLVEGTNVNLSALHTVVMPSLNYIDFLYRLYPPSAAQRMASLFNAAIAHVNYDLSVYLCRNLGIPMTLPVNVAPFDVNYGYRKFGIIGGGGEFRHAFYFFDPSRADLYESAPPFAVSEVDAFVATNPTMEEFTTGKWSLYQAHFRSEYPSFVTGQFNPLQFYNASPFAGLSRHVSVDENAISDSQFSTELQPSRPPECDKCWDDGIDGILFYGAMGTGVGYAASKSWIGAVSGGAAAVIFKTFDTMQQCRDPCYQNLKKQVPQAKSATAPDAIGSLGGGTGMPDPGTVGHELASQGLGYPTADGGEPTWSLEHFSDVPGVDEPDVHPPELPPDQSPGPDELPDQPPVIIGPKT